MLNNSSTPDFFLLFLPLSCGRFP